MVGLSASRTDCGRLFQVTDPTTETALSLSSVLVLMLEREEEEDDDNNNNLRLFDC